MAGAPKKGLDVGIVFGMGKPHGGPMPMHGDDGGDPLDEPRDMLISALHDVGIKGEEASALVEALHEYVDACIEMHEQGPEEEHEGEEETPESARREGY